MLFWYSNFSAIVCLFVAKLHIVWRLFFSAKCNRVDKCNAMLYKWQRICCKYFSLSDITSTDLMPHTQYANAIKTQHDVLPHFKRFVILPFFLYCLFDVNSVCLCKYFLFPFELADGGSGFFFYTFTFRVRDLLSRMNFRLQCPI